MKNFWKALSLISRRMTATPGFTFLAVLMIGVGVGASTVIFSVVNGALLEPLPVALPEQLVRIRESQPERGWDEFSVAEPNFLDWKSRNRVFSEIAAINWRRVNLSGGDQPERAQAVLVSAGMLPMLGITPNLGRFFLAEEDQPGAGRRVTVLSQGLWQRRFGGDPKVLGSSVTIDGHRHEVIGVGDMPLREIAGDLFLPLAASPEAERDNHELEVIARLKPGVTLTQARAEMENIARALSTEYPETNAGWTVKVSSLFDVMIDSSFKRALAVLSVGAFCLLLAACANVASLHIARSSGRAHELSLRAALGAGRWHLMGHSLVESLAVGGLGGGLGLLLALWGVDLLKHLDAGNIPRLDEVELDARVLVFSMVCALLTGLLAGLVPALKTASASPRRVLAEAGPSVFGARGEWRLQAGLVILEVALSMVLLVGAGLLLRSHSQLTQLELGFAVDDRLTLGYSIPEERYPTSADAAALTARLIERVQAVPGVVSAASVSSLPFGTFSTMLEFELPDRPPEASGPPRSAAWRLVTPSYFDTLRIPLVAGRPFSASDNNGAPEVAIISQHLAELHFPGESPLGRRIASRAVIVGVVGDVRERKLETEPASMVYFPSAQARWSNMSLVVELAANPAAVVPGLRAALTELDGDLAFADIQLLRERLDKSLAPRRFHLILLTVFAAVALVLAVGGLYGVLATAVAMRRREIGVRMALGAESGRVVRLVLRRALGVAGLGLALGLVVSGLATRALSSLLFGIEPLDGATYVGVALLLGVSSALASALPALAASRVDPRETLKAG